MRLFNLKGCGPEDQTEFVWRRGRDSNPRETCISAGFQDRCIRPLCHPSAAVSLTAVARGAIPASCMLPAISIRANALTNASEESDVEA